MFGWQLKAHIFTEWSKPSSVAWHFCASDTIQKGHSLLSNWHTYIQFCTTLVNLPVRV